MVQVVRIREWKQLLEFEPEFPQWVFRGHSCSSWPLETSLHRAVSRSREPGLSYDDDFAFAERMSLRTFRSRAHLYLNHLPHDEDHVGWLAVMQHHGAPTRLLDFTKSLYVACYFALIDSAGDSCVWAIDEGWLLEQGGTYAGELGVKARNELRFGKIESIYKAANIVAGSNNFDVSDYESPKRSVLLVDVPKQIPRLAVQQGLFLMPTDVEAPFLENLIGRSGKRLGKRSKYVRKLVFSHRLRSDGLAHLGAMNITAETLFPGIDGFARSLFQHDMLV